MDQADLPKPDPPVAPADGPSSSQQASEAQVLAVLARLRPSPFVLGGGCRWIAGDPRAPGGPEACGARRVRGRPYCRAHCLQAYVGLQQVSAATERLAVAAHSSPAADTKHDAERGRTAPREGAWPER
jgi:hypothetical protein